MSDEDDFRPRKRKRRSPWDGIFGPFGENFGEIFEQMESMFEDVLSPFRIHQNKPEFEEEGEGEEDIMPKHFVWGLRLNIGPDGKPTFEQFGNVPRMGIEGIKPSEEREPLIDIIKEPDVIRIIAEVPGVSKEDVDLSATETSLRIQARSKEGSRSYYKELELPARVIPESSRGKFKNGVLEVELKRKDPDISRESDTRIKVD